MTRRLLPYGDHARLLECHDLDDSQRMLRWLEDQHRPEVTGIVPGARTLLLELAAPPPQTFLQTMIDIELGPVAIEETELVIIDVDYDGPDLAEVAEHLRISEDEVVSLHTGQDWVVAFCGFSPGFGYLASTGQTPSVPRKQSPRTRVPAGSVALADHWSAIYPTASPGGWQLIGSTDNPMINRLFDVDADPPALLSPGTRVRFRRRES